MDMNTTLMHYYISLEYMIHLSRWLLVIILIIFPQMTLHLLLWIDLISLILLFLLNFVQVLLLLLVFLFVQSNPLNPILVDLHQTHDFLQVMVPKDQCLKDMNLLNHRKTWVENFDISFVEIVHRYKLRLSLCRWKIEH